jgi:hypothetical protein
MHGVQYVTDEQGEKTAVLIDLKKMAIYGKISMMSPLLKNVNAILVNHLNP